MDAGFLREAAEWLADTGAAYGGRCVLELVPGGRVGCWQICCAFIPAADRGPGIGVQRYWVEWPTGQNQTFEGLLFAAAVKLERQCSVAASSLGFDL